MGARSGSVGVRVGATVSELSGWVSDSSVVCKVASGARGCVAVAITVGVRTGSVSDVLSFDGAVLSDTSSTNFNPAGGGLVTIFGQSFAKQDYSVQVRVGGTACNAVAWLSETSVVCKAPKLEIWDFPTSIAVTQSRLVGSFTEPFFYAVPQCPTNAKYYRSGQALEYCLCDPGYTGDGIHHCTVCPPLTYKPSIGNTPCAWNNGSVVSIALSNSTVESFDSEHQRRFSQALADALLLTTPEIRITALVTSREIEHQLVLQVLLLPIDPATNLTTLSALLIEVVDDGRLQGNLASGDLWMLPRVDSILEGVGSEL
eukprot:951447-Rhodomonas_salina.1